MILILKSLQDSVEKLLRLGENGAPVYADEFCMLNRKVLETADILFQKEAQTPDQGAGLVIVLLKAYETTLYNSTAVEIKKQALLKRGFEVLGKLPESTLKCKLLFAAYGETGDSYLMAQAKEIIMSWGGRELTEDEVSMIERWNELSVSE